MTVSSSLNKVRYEGNGVTTIFSFSFPALAVGDLQVYSVVRATGVATLLSYGTHYTAALNNGTEGGAVTMLAAPDALTDIFIKRVVVYTQSSEFPPESELPEKSFENGLDKAMMSIQQVDERVSRALLFPTTSMTGDKFLPEPVAGRALEWGDDGNVVNSLESLSGTIVAAQAAQAAAEAAQAAAETAEANAELAETNAETAEANAELAEANAEAARDATLNFTNRGLWLDTTEYQIGNLVGYTKSDSRFGTYMALQTHTGQNPETSTGYWTLVAQDGISEIQFRKDITFAATFDTVQELKDNGMITNYTSVTDPLLFPATSSNSYQFPQANVIAGGKFGNCLDFTQTAKALVVPEKNVDLSGEFSISFWVKSPCVNNTSFFGHSSRSLQVTLTSGGTMRVQLTTDDGTARYVTGSTNLTSGVAWYNIIILGKVNSGTTDFLKLYVDGVSEGTQITGTSMPCSGLEAGRMVIGAGYLYVAGLVTDNCTTLPSASTPAWTFTGTNEGVDCSVSGGILDIDTINGSGGTASALYQISDGANWTVLNAAGYWLEIKCKINAVSGTGAFSMHVGDGTKYAAVTLCPTYVMSAEGKRYYLDATKYHTYRVCVKGSSYYVFVDCVRVIEGVASGAGIDFIRFGDADGTSGSNIDVSIDAIRYYQNASGETSLIGAECDTYIDDFAVFNTIITASDIAALQLASVTALQTFVDGSGITNIGRSHIAIQDLIDAREYEENIDMFINQYTILSSTYRVYIPFHTRKRVIPTIVLTVSTTAPVNVTAYGASEISVSCFNIYVTANVSGLTELRLSWQAQCASKTKILDITDDGFDLVLGTPIVDAKGDHTGEYSTEKVAVKMDDVKTSDDGKVMVIRHGNTAVFMPVAADVAKIKALGFNDNNLSVQSAKLVDKKVKIEKDKKDKEEKDKKDKEEKDKKDKEEKELKDGK